MIQQTNNPIVDNQAVTDIQTLKEVVKIQEYVIIVLIEMLKNNEGLTQNDILRKIEKIENMPANTLDDVYFAKAATWFKALNFR